MNPKQMRITEQPITADNMFEQMALITKKKLVEQGVLPSDANEDELEITGLPYKIWKQNLDKKITRELAACKIKIIGDANGIMTISGNPEEIDKVKKILIFT